MIRKIAALLCGCLLIGFILCGCSSTSSKPKAGEMVPVYDDSGTLTGYEKYSYNAAEKLSRLDRYDASEEYQSYVIYEYDSEGRLYQETTYAANGIGMFFYNYEYDDEDRIYRETYVTMSDGYTVSLYEEGEKDEVYSYDSKGNLISHQLLTDGEWVDAPEDTIGETSSENPDA